MALSLLALLLSTGDPAASKACVPASAELHFATGSFALDPAPNDALARIAGAVASSPSRFGLIVTGHSDRVGTGDSNHLLSEQRADAVVARLVATGVPAARIERRAAGETMLVVKTGDDIAEQRNRRVDVTVRTPLELDQVRVGGDPSPPILCPATPG